jgi:ankyrin repeat protein
LLNHGADPSSKNEKGQTTMDIAKARGDGKLVALIEGAIAERQAATDDDDIAF